MATYMTNLLEAVHQENLPRVKALLSRGADVNTADSHGVTPLIIACERGELKMVDLLLEAKASTKCATNDTQSTCLHFAAKHHWAEVVRRLLKADPTIQERATVQGDTALMLACLSADETGKTASTLAAMLEPLVLSSDNRAQDGEEGGRRSKFPLGPYDPRLRASNRHGHTALHCAAFASCPTAVRMLLEAGADCTVGDKAGRTAFDVALNLAGKKTPVREAGRGGGSTPAAECLDLLRNRWRQLEHDARDKEMRLLGELDADRGDKPGGVKGRRGNGGARESAVPNGARKSSRKKKRKQQQHSPEQRQKPSTPGGGVDGGQISATSAGVESAVTTGSNGVRSESQNLNLGALRRGAESGEARASVGVGASSGKVRGGGRRESSDSEGQTDDEAGSHPSSETDSGSHQDPAEGRMEAATIDESVADVLAEVEEGPARATEGAEMLAAVMSDAANGAVDSDPVSNGISVLDDGTVRENGKDTGSGSGGDSWSVVGPKTRKKKAAASLQTPPLPPSRSRHQTRPAMPPRGEGGKSRLRASGAAYVPPLVSPRPADFPPLPGRVHTLRDTKGSATNGGRAEATIALASSRMDRAAEHVLRQEAKAPSAKLTHLPQSSNLGASAAAMSMVQAPAAVNPAASAGVVVTTVNEVPNPVARAADSNDAEAGVATATVVVATVSAAVAVKEKEVNDGAALAVNEEEVNEEARLSDDGGGRSSGVKRQLNVNANAWMPSSSLVHRQHPSPHPPTATPPPPPLQQPMQQMRQVQQMPMHMPMHMHLVHPPMPFPAVPIASESLRHQPLSNPHPHPHHPLPTVMWRGHQIPYGAGHVNAVNGSTGSAGGFAPGYGEVHQTLQMNQGHGVNIPHPGGMPPQTVPTSQSGGGGGFVVEKLALPPTPASAVVTSREAWADGAQIMLEASSPEAAALALKVEHLVWGIEALSSGLSMGQLDTLKAFLLDQATRVDEAKLEQVRAQERSKNEEKSASILQQLHQAQSSVPGSPPPATASPPSACSTDAETVSVDMDTTAASGNVENTSRDEGSALIAGSKKSEEAEKGREGCEQDHNKGRGRGSGDIPAIEGRGQVVVEGGVVEDSRESTAARVLKEEYEEKGTMTGGAEQSSPPLGGEGPR